MLLQHTVVTERFRMAIRIKQAVKRERDRKLRERLCLVCEEPIVGPSRRGDCPACRKAIERKIARGASEESFIRAGLLTELSSPEQKPKAASSKRQKKLERICG